MSEDVWLIPINNYSIQKAPDSSVILFTNEVMKKKPSPDTRSLRTLILNFASSQTIKNHLLYLSGRYFVTSVQKCHHFYLLVFCICRL